MLIPCASRHRVNDKVSLASDTRYGTYSRYFQYSTLDQCTAACTAGLFDGDPATEANGGNGGQSPYDMATNWGLQNITTARVDYDLGSLKNQLIVGVDLSRQSSDRHYLAYTLPAGIATRPAMPHPLVNPNPNFPAGYTLFNPVPGVNLTCPATGNCTTVTSTASRSSPTRSPPRVEASPRARSTDVPASSSPTSSWLTARRCR